MRKWIIDRRMQMQLTQEDLAKKTELTRQAISSYETGNRGSKFGVPLLLKMAAALDMSMEDAIKAEADYLSQDLESSESA